MTTDDEQRWRYHGWRMVAVAFLCHFVGAGFFFYSYGVFFKAVATNLHGSRFAVSLGLSCAHVVSALAAPLIGRAIERSVRLVIVAGALSCATGFALMTQVAALWQFYLVLAALVGPGVVSLSLAPSALVTGWFQTRRGTALGIATVGVSLSGLVMPGVATWLVTHLGWRGGFGVYAIATLLLIIPAARLVVPKPEDPICSDDDIEREPLHPTMSLLKSRVYWCLAGTFALALFSVTAVLTHLVPHLTDVGLRPYHAAALLSLAAGTAVAGKVAFGAIADRTADPRRAVWLCLAFQLLGILLLRALDTTAGLACAAIVFGFGMGGVIPLQNTLTAAAFGQRSFARAAGLLRPVMLPISAAGVPMAGYLFDRSGSYDGALVIVAVASVLAACALVPLPSTMRQEHR